MGQSADLFAEQDSKAGQFEPTPAAAAARLAAIRPSEYARSRNHLDGAVTRLSPYLTHGFLSLVDVVQALHARGLTDVQHKLIYELGWRAYFHHVWQHLGEGITQNLHDGLLPDEAYLPEMPADITTASTGVPVVDRAVGELYRTGWLHNHARMWLASYTVHVRHVHWQAGAQWMLGHLIDGDLASNHLSWQWVAGTGSHKPYLFNADNVARYAPADWHSPGSVVDTSYEALERRARSGGTLRLSAAQQAASEPPLEPTKTHTAPPEMLASFTAADARQVAGRRVWLMHPWHLASPPASFDGVVLGVLPDRPSPLLSWSPLRWRFVTTRMAAACDRCWMGSAAELGTALGAAGTVEGVDNRHLDSALRLPGLAQPVDVFEGPRRHCTSFSQYWRHVTRGIGSTSELLRNAGR